MARPARPMDPDSERELLRAAARAFAGDGYRAASLNDILQSADCAKSSLYHYFDGKKGLHDRVVTVLRARLGEGLELPDLAALTADDFWPAMTRLVDSLGRTAQDHPEVRQLGLMYHRDDSAPAGCALQQLRADVTQWLDAAVRRGIDLGLVRSDIPADLAVELATAVLGVLDRWALSRATQSPGVPDTGRLSLTLIRDLVAGPGRDRR